MSFLDWVLIIIAGILVVGALLGNGDGLSLIFKGGAEKYYEFEASSLLRWSVAGFALLMVLGYVGYRVAVKNAKDDYSTYRVDFDKTEATAIEARKTAEQVQVKAEILAEREAFEARISKLEGETRIVRDDPDFRLVQAVSKVEGGASEGSAIPHTVVRLLLDDAFGEKQLAVVYHLFEDSGAWRYNSAAATDPTDFFARLSESSTASTLATYDYVIGVGLGSNSPAQVPDMSQRRARYLCGALSAMLPSDNDTPVLGLSIGDYQGVLIDTRGDPQPQQRPILIAGVERTSPQLNEQALILEMMMSFDYSGIDFRQYSALSDRRRLNWYEISECDLR